MNNAIQVFKKNESETLEGMQEEWAQEELSERKLQRVFDEINSAVLAARRKAEEDFARARKLAIQM